MSADSQTAGTGPPGVSVVIPAYNYAQFLPEAIDSVLQQTYSHYEVIVVDDGSTDHTPAVVQAYGDRVRYKWQPNAGLPAARNTGIRAARFNFVAFLDSDDGWLPTFLQRAMETFSQLSPDYAIVACRSLFIDASGRRLERKCLVAESPDEITCRDIILRTRFGSTAVVARKNAFETCGYFDETLRSSEDRDMWMRIAARNRLRLLPDRLVLIRRHSGSMSGQTDRMKANVRKVINKAYSSRLAPRCAVGFWLRVLAFHYFQNAWGYHDEGRRGDAMRDMLISLFFWPCFLHPHRLNEPRLFRARSLLQFARGKSLETPVTGHSAICPSG